MVKRKITFDDLWQRYQFWIEAPVFYLLGWCLNFIMAIGVVHGEEGKVADGLPDFALILVTALAPIWVLLWFNIRGKGFFVRGRLAHLAAVHLRGNQVDGLLTYYAFSRSIRRRKDPSWLEQLAWNDEGHKRWSKTLREAWELKYGTGLSWPDTGAWRENPE